MISREPCSVRLLLRQRIVAPLGFPHLAAGSILFLLTELSCLLFVRLWL